MRVTRLRANATAVVDADAAVADEDATELLASAVSLLQEDFVRNDPRTAAALTLGWDELRDFVVRTDPDL